MPSPGTPGTTPAGGWPTARETAWDGRGPGIHRRQDRPRHPARGQRCVPPAAPELWPTAELPELVAVPGDDTAAAVEAPLEFEGRPA